ncbi:hypothetical protein GCM10022422_17270 [Flavobacterium ginsengisoli]|uniref:DUF3885 domain-containing protein n=1 Tax=Flavobacterium ginsengisoli TaxID=871694 RepID=A0ABP7FAL9_9FLAO|nr:hypothetical protein [Flavobacterium ginsengisoli]
MRKTRAIYFEYNGIVEHFDFGTFSLCMYYATLINSLKAKKLFEATISEWKYRVEYDLPEDNFTSDDDIAHFQISEITEAIEFIEDILIPSLNNETKDILLKYGGKSNFVKLYYNNAGFLKFNGITENEFFETKGESLAYHMNRLKIILQYSLDFSQPFMVYVN